MYVVPVDVFYGGLGRMRYGRVPYSLANGSDEIIERLGKVVHGGIGEVARRSGPLNIGVVTAHGARARVGRRGQACGDSVVGHAGWYGVHRMTIGPEQSELRIGDRHMT